MASICYCINPFWGHILTKLLNAVWVLYLSPTSKRLYWAKRRVERKLTRAFHPGEEIPVEG